MIVDAFVTETNYTVWNDVSSNLGKLASILQYTDCGASFKKFLRQLYKPIADKIGWDPKEDEGTVLQSTFGFVFCGFPP